MHVVCTAICTVATGSARATIATFCDNRTTGQVLSAEMRFSADKGLSAEVSAAVGYLAEKSEIEQIFWGNARSELSVLVNACWMTCLNTNFILFLNCRILG